MIPNQSSSDENENPDGINPNRRAVLKGAGTLGGVSIVGVGTVVANNGNGNGNGGGGRGRDDRGGNPQEDCKCPDGARSAKYDFDSDECEFVLSEGEDLVSITVTETKEDEECEPVVIGYETVDGGSVVTKICSFGGTDNHSIDGDSKDWVEGTYESDLTNPGGQRAAISNVTFCVEERETIDAFQVDLIHDDGKEDPILPDPCGLDEDDAYNVGEERLLQAKWGWGDPDDLSTRLEDVFEDNPGAYEDCFGGDIGDGDNGVSSDDALSQNIEFDVEDGVATAQIDTDALTGGCEVSDFSLVSYKSWNEDDGEDPNFDNCDRQEVFATDLGGSNDGGFKVDIPVDLL